MIEIFLTPENLIALVTLAALEIVLGIDNIVFIAILTGRLKEDLQPRARKVGLLAAMVMRILLLLAISWVMGLTKALFEVFGHGVSGRDLILLLGGLFLIAKSTFEIHERLEEAGQLEHETEAKSAVKSFAGVIIQIMLIDIVFSLDSVITAVGMAKEVAVMIAAIVIAVGVMMVFAEAVSGFIAKHPTMKVLALSFLLLIGVMLVAEGLGKHIERGYIYFAMGFSLLVEMINIQIAKRRKKSKVKTEMAEA
jgi:predicted tellurium resistance membrane protein TerC